MRHPWAHFVWRHHGYSWFAIDDSPSTPVQTFRVNLYSPYKILHTPVKPRITISASYALAHQNCIFGEDYASLSESPAPDFCSRRLEFVHRLWFQLIGGPFRQRHSGHARLRQ